MNLRYVSYVVKIAILFGVYFFTAKLGLSLGAVSGFATLVWLPTGISLAALILFGYKLWPAILAAAFLVNFLAGAPLFAAIGISIGNTLEALVGVYLLKRYAQFHPSLNRQQDVFGLIFLAAIISTMVSATIGVFSLVLSNTITPSLNIWLAWWIGDMISNLIAAPLLLVWSTRPSVSKQVPQIVEVFALSMGVIITGLFVFGSMIHIETQNPSLTYLVFPPLIWAALRFGQRGAVTAAFIMSIIAVIGTVLGYGPFARQQLDQSLLMLQSFMGVTTATVMILAAVVAERKASERRKDDFISMASHELKTPITSIKAFTQILQKILTKSADKRALPYLNRMDMQLDKLTHLVNDLLDLSKIQAGKLELRREYFSLPTLIKDIVDNMQLTATQHKIHVKGTITDKVYADKERITEVILNLLSNAIKYSPQAKKIVIKMTQNKRTAIVSVQDYGVGIAKDDHKRIFDRFFQVATNGGIALPGLGIGLYLSRQIIKYHAGKIWLESTQGKGTTFYFSIPIDRVPIDNMEGN